MNNPDRGPSLTDFKEYERLATESIILINLARLQRQVDLLDQQTERVVIVTGYGLKPGMEAAVIEERRAIKLRGDYKTDVSPGHEELRHGAKTACDEGRRSQDSTGDNKGA